MVKTLKFNLLSSFSSWKSNRPRKNKFINIGLATGFAFFAIITTTPSDKFATGAKIRLSSKIFTMNYCYATTRISKKII